MRRVLYVIAVAAGFVLAATLWTGCTIVRDNSANSGEVWRMDVFRCPPPGAEREINRMEAVGP